MTSLLTFLLHLLIFLLASDSASAFKHSSFPSKLSRQVSTHQRLIRLLALDEKDLDLLDYLRNEMIRAAELSKDVYAADRDLQIERFELLQIIENVS